MTGSGSMSRLQSDPALSQMPERRNALVVLDGIWRYWGRGKDRWAVLRGIDLEVAPGMVTGISGRNGAGKTTLLRIATAILAPDAGTVTVDGITSDGNWREYHRRIGFLSAGDRGLYARFSVRGHLDYCARIAFIPRDRRGQAVEDAMVRFGLTDLAARRADRLSQGQRQRLRLALTLVHEPQVLLLDEPRNSLDDEGLAMLSRAIDEVLARRGSVIWCSPAGDEESVEFDRRLIIEDGVLRPA
ncbi:MAG TPA: ABC transporter ATP-binding protein [Solirubrobacteraceae bacterium]|nr:ABC transporter ATP-binding protein [Solirubrobacteraceae bacterium]